MKAVLVIALAIALCAASVAALVKIDDVTQSALEKGHNLNIIVYFPRRERASESFLKKLSNIERRRLVYTELLATAASSQDVLRKILHERGFETKTFWINNALLIKNASPVLIKELRENSRILEIEAEKDVAFVHAMVHEVFDKLPPRSQRVHTQNKTKNMAVEWNIDAVNAPSTWEITKGYDVTIANIDTGVLYTHESLKRRYRGYLASDGFDHDYNWHDPRGTPYPFDNNGHGTHTMGSIIGDDQVSGIGVAPEALWIAAKGCSSSSCSNADLISSFQYLLAPTRQDGTRPDVSYAPQIISNSWGGGQGSTSFLSAIEPHVESGTVIVFSQGNSGSGCNTANSPGDLSIVIGVGSTNINNQLSSFSSRGPGINNPPNFNIQKPDISAPGERVLSSYYTSDTAYASLSGTSMACPHVAGVLAFLYDLYPSLSVEEARSIITRTASTRYTAPNGGQQACGGVLYTAVPNYHYGYGIIDSLAAINALPKK